MDRSCLRAACRSLHPSVEICWQCSQSSAWFVFNMSLTLKHCHAKLLMLQLNWGTTPGLIQTCWINHTGDSCGCVLGFLRGKLEFFHPVFLLKVKFKRNWSVETWFIPDETKKEADVVSEVLLRVPASHQSSFKFFTNRSVWCFHKRSSAFKSMEAAFLWRWGNLNWFQLQFLPWCSHFNFPDTLFWAPLGY